jgi:hypothetical protein
MNSWHLGYSVIQRLVFARRAFGDWQLAKSKTQERSEKSGRPRAAFGVL